MLDKQNKARLDDLVELLKAMTLLHDRFLPLIAEKRAALGKADHHAIAELSQRENQIVQAVSEMEKRRLTLVAELTLAVDPQASRPLDLMGLADAIPEPGKGLLLVCRHQLKTKMQQVRQANQVALASTSTLLHHMESLTRKVACGLTKTVTYDRGGARPTKALAVSTIDTKA